MNPTKRVKLSKPGNETEDSIESASSEETELDNNARQLTQSDSINKFIAEFKAISTSMIENLIEEAKKKSESNIEKILITHKDSSDQKMDLLISTVTAMSQGIFFSNVK